jgi:glyoxylase-like metal-dependent hydrolase (beta-lactamase superfamily II)
LTARHTPGHAEGHITLHDSRYGAAIVGDMASTISTIVIDPKEGHLRTYLESLQRLLDVAPGPRWTLLPAHGPWVADGAKLVKRYLEHRDEREVSLLRALKGGLETMEELVARVYSATPPSLWPYAELSLHAGLIKLEEDGLAMQTTAGWRIQPEAVS